jgi:TolA-binding protein
MKPDHDSIFDLLALARRGDLPEADERRLRHLLATSAEARLLHDTGCAFDREAPVVAGDDERVARIEQEVLARLRERPAARRMSARFIVRACLVAAMITTSAVGASILSRKAPGPAALPSATPPVTASVEGERGESGPALAPVPTTRPSPPPTMPEPEALPTPSDPPAPPALPPKTTRAALPSAAPPPETRETRETVSPQALFSAASRARVRGDGAEAIRLSRQLVTEFPSSNEAVTTHLSLGMLYLQEGQVGPALDEFRAGRRLGPPVTMAEAIWGESQALRKLGRTVEERAALEELLSSYPESAYTGAARKRLAALP